MQTLTDDEKIRLGYGAARMLEDEAVQAVMQDMKNILHQTLDSMQSDNEQDVMSIVRQLRVIRAIQGKLESYKQQGQYLERLRNGKSK